MTSERFCENGNESLSFFVGKGSLMKDEEDPWHLHVSRFSSFNYVRECCRLAYTRKLRKQNEIR